MKILVLSNTFPTATQPVHGIFVKERIRALSNLHDVNIKVISPKAYFPSWAWINRHCKRYSIYSKIPNYESIDSLDVFRPTYPLAPKIGGYFHPHLMYYPVYNAIKQVYRQFKFDLIDSHFIYPDGVLATWLGRKFNVPVCITCRGEDILCYPKLPLIGTQIKKAIRQCSHLIALSNEIKSSCQANGATSDKVSVIGNGISCEKFPLIDQQVARNRLKLPSHTPIIVSAGYLLELKGFHILVDALQKVRVEYPTAQLIIVGGVARWGKDFTAQIHQRIQAHNLQDAVTMTGVRPQDELKYWFNAADCFALMTSREGSPNVIQEALACGTPVMATSVGGIPEVLADQRLGLILHERTAHAAAKGLATMLQTPWDRHIIHQLMQKKDWVHTANKIHKIFTQHIHPST